MSEGRLPCSACGASILATTSARTGGLCMPCKNGYREHLTQAKAFYEKQETYRQSPERKHWEWLVEQVHRSTGGFQALSLPNRLYYAVSEVSGEVYNGGFDQYFHNSAADHYATAVDGLAAMGATKSLELLHTAKQLMFGDADVPATEGQRHEVIGLPDDREASGVAASLDKLDRAFWKEPDGLAGYIERFAEEHRLREGF